MPERPIRNLLAVKSRDVAGEHRDTERAVTLWHQRASDDAIPSLTAFDFYRLTGDWGYRFIISGDEVVAAAVFIIYGLQFARLFDLPAKPRSHVPAIQQLPARYHQLFADGCSEVITQAVPVRFSGAAARRVGPKSQYHWRIIARTARRSPSGLRRLLRRPRRFEIKPLGPSVRYAFNNRNT